MSIKFSQLLARLGASLTGTEVVALEAAAGSPYNASTISAAAADNSINDSADGLPIMPAGAAVDISDFVDSAGELNGEHVVVSSTSSKLVVETDITQDESAGASVTVQEKQKSYQLLLNELANFIAGVSLPDPIVGSTFKDSRETVYIASSSSLNVSNGNMQQRTLAGNETLEVTLAPSEGSVLLYRVIVGAHTQSIGVSVDGWIGDAPTTITGDYWLAFVSMDAGATVYGVDLGAAS